MNNPVVVERELLRACSADLSDWRRGFPFAETSTTDRLIGEIDTFLASQPAEAGGVGHDTIACWNCAQNVTLEARDDEDGFCPHCMCELDLSDYLINAKAALSAVTAERDRLREENERLKRAAQTNWNEFSDSVGEIDKLRAEVEALRTQLAENTPS